MSRKELINEILDNVLGESHRTEDLEEGFGAIAHYHYGGNAVGVSSWRNDDAEQMAKYMEHVSDEDLHYVVGPELAEKIRQIRGNNE